MKVHLKFDHTQKEVLKAIDYQGTAEQANEQMEDVMMQYLNSSEMKTASQLAEAIHNTIDYEIILFLASKSIEERLKDVMLEKMKDDFRDLLDL
jgi:ABC-type xylose transport system substrate-binding protein